MLELNFSTNIRAISNQIGMLKSRYIPEAAAMSLTTLAKMVADRERANEESKIDRVRPFTLNAIGVIRATVKSQRSTVFMKDITAAYMDAYEFGGLNKLNGKYLLKPMGEIPSLNRYGNLARNYTANMKARADIFIGTVKTKKGPIKGIWQRSSEPGEKVAIRRNKNGKIYMGKTGAKTNTSGKLKLLVELTDAHPIAERNRLHWFDIAGKLVMKNFNAEFGKALSIALAKTR